MNAKYKTDIVAYKMKALQSMFKPAKFFLFFCGSFFGIEMLLRNVAISIWN